MAVHFLLLATEARKNDHENTRIGRHAVLETEEAGAKLMGKID